MNEIFPDTLLTFIEVEESMVFYDFKAKRLNGREVSLEEYKDKVVLVVNTASKCGFTPQLTGLTKLYEKYSDKGFVILGFPCNQFGRQDPDGEARNNCLINYGVRFPMFERIDVNGANAHPLFNYLKVETGGILGNNIKWNFTKFLIDRKGKVVKRFAPITKPEKIESYMMKLL